MYMTIIEKMKEREAEVLRDIIGRGIKDIKKPMVSAEDMIRLIDIRIETLEAELQFFKLCKDPDYFNVADADIQIGTLEHIKELLKRIPD